MIKPPKPRNESQRQAVLELLNILDTHAENAYDDLTRVASQICQTPIAVISLTDNERQWFKSKIGIEGTESPRDTSFCGHAITGTDLMEVSDALKDERFMDNPQVIGAPHIRFYAGAPLITPTGEVLGTICVVDRNPRQLDASQRAALRILARNVVSQIQLHSLVAGMAERESALNSVILQTIEVSNARAAFFARMSHEFRTPLNGVLGMIQALSKTKLDQEQIECVEVAKEASESLIRLVNDILDASTIEAGRLSIEEIDFDLNLLVQKNIQLFAWSAAAKNLVVECKTNSKALWVKSDPTRVAQILTNLLSNAIKFTESGTISVELHSTVNQLGLVQVDLVVSDTGIGISPKAQAKLFMPYTQADESIHRRFGGSGLGLSISKSLAEALGGSLTCQSQQGRGSTFHLSLAVPSAIARASEGVANIDISAAQIAANFAKLRVLIAEDEPTNQRVFKAFFKLLGCEYNIVPDGHQAIAAASSRNFDVILMDRLMPDCDGVEATRLIRKRENALGMHTPILAITASSDMTERQKLIDIGIDDFLEKPLRIEKVAEKLMRWTTKRKAG